MFQVKDVDVMKAGKMATFLPSFSFVYFSDCLGTLLGERIKGVLSKD